MTGPHKDGLRSTQYDEVSRSSSTGQTRVVLGGPRPGAIAFRRCRLEVIDGPDQGEQVELARERLRIGAGEVNDLVLGDPYVSRLHAEINLVDEGFRLTDLGSTNGTWVGGVRVVEAFVEPGCTITVGRSVVRFATEGGEVPVTLDPDSVLGDLVGESVTMRLLFAQLKRVAAADCTVLLVGETGTGKDVAADAIVRASPRADGPVVVVDCAASVPTLIEAELFGHERGAFTGALTERAGAFERAHGGTLFLDEIGEMPLQLQPKLLRVLESRQTRRIGAAQPVPVDVRILAATSRPLADEVNRGTFRADLYYRLAVVELLLPPLRERPEDIPLIAEHLLRRMGHDPALLSEELVATLGRYSWPGNVRELRNFLERSVALSDFHPPHPALDGVDEAPARTWPPALALEAPFRQAKDAVTAAFERTYLAALLERAEGNVSRAAKQAQMNRMHLHKLLEQHGLVIPRKRRR